MKGLPAGQRAPAGDVLHPTAVRDQTLLSHHVIEVGGVELGEAVLLRDVDLRVRTEQVRSKIQKHGTWYRNFVSVVP